MTKHPITAEKAFPLREYGLALSKLQNCDLRLFEAGEVILNQGTAVDQIFIILQGKVKVCTLASNGKDLTICYYISNGILGDIELMQEEKCAPATSIAVLPCVCIRVPLEDNLAYLLSNAVFVSHVAKGLSTKLLDSSTAYIASTLYSGEERLCSYILMAEHHGLFTDILADVSKYIGISYRHLFRLLNELCKKGVLARSASGFQIINKEYLLKKGAAHK